MSDTKPAADEALNNPADVVAQIELSAQDPIATKSEENSAVAGTVANSTTMDATTESKSKDYKAAGDSAEAAKSEESSTKSDEKQENGSSDKKGGSGRKDDRYSKYDRGDKRKSSYNDRHRTQYKKSRTNEFADLPETDDPIEIRAQVEFYFSVQNLSTDRHMFLEIKGAENRPVPIKHITSFKRMHRFQPYSAVVAAMRDSQDLIVIDDGEFSGAGNEALQRKEPLAVPKRDNDDEYKPTTEQLYDRMFRASQNKLDASVYVKGFGKEENAGQIALENFFKPYGSVMVRKRRDEENNWKGSVFVEFDCEDSQQQFLGLDPKPKFDGNELFIMSKKAYSEKKCEEKGITPAWKQEPGAGEGSRREYRERDGRGRGGGRGRGRGRGRGGHDGRGRGGGRHTDRRRDNRDRSRSRSPRRSRRDRSDSRDSHNSSDWNGRRDKFQKSRDYNGRDKRDKSDRSHDKPRSGKTEDKDNSGIYHAKNIIRDADGVPVIQDTSKDASTKRKADNDGEENIPKKSKIEIKVDA